MAELDCSNLFGVRAPHGQAVWADWPAGGISADDALNLAAWLVAIADPVGTRFLALYSAITGAEPADVLEGMASDGPSSVAEDGINMSEDARPTPPHEHGGEA